MYLRDGELDRLRIGNRLLTVHALDRPVSQGRRVVGRIDHFLGEDAVLVLQPHPVDQLIGIGGRIVAGACLIAGMLQIPADRCLRAVIRRGVFAAHLIAARQIAGYQFRRLVVEADELDRLRRVVDCRHRVVGHPVRHGAGLHLVLDLRKDPIERGGKTVGIRAVVIVARTDAVPQPVLVGLRAAGVANLVCRARAVHDGVITCFLALRDVLLNGLTGHIHADGEDGRTGALDRRGLVSGPDGGLVAVTRA